MCPVYMFAVPVSLVIRDGRCKRSKERDLISVQGRCYTSVSNRSPMQNHPHTILIRMHREEADKTQVHDEQKPRYYRRPRENYMYHEHEREQHARLPRVKPVLKSAHLPMHIRMHAIRVIHTSHNRSDARISTSPPAPRAATASTPNKLHNPSSTRSPWRTYRHPLSALRAAHSTRPSPAAPRHPRRQSSLFADTTAWKATSRPRYRCYVCGRSRYAVKRWEG